MAIKERRELQLEKHYKALETLATMSGVKDANGKKLSNALRKIEQDASADSIKYANGEIDTAKWGELKDKYKTQALKLFNNNLPGFYLNSDPRGYALKIKTEFMIPGGKYENINLQRDWGSYGLLAPEITGK